MQTARIGNVLLDHPDAQPAVGLADGHATYAALREQVRQFSRQLTDHGVTEGERVVICLPNASEAIVAVLAAIHVGAIAVPVHEDESAQLGALVEVAGASHCVESDGAGGIVVSHRNRAPTGDGIAPPEVDTCLIRFSSGYSGEPKGVCLSEAQMCHMARTLREAAQLTSAHRELIITPIAFSGAWQRVAATLCAGGTITFAQPGPLTVRGLLEDLQTCNASGFFATPSLVRILLAAPAEQLAIALAGCRSVEIGSASLNAAELEALLDVVPGHVLVHYGLTECSRATLLDARAHPEKLHTVGRPSPGVRIAFADAGGKPSTHIRGGEILLQGPQVTGGYWPNRELDAERFVDGWLHTRDLGELDDDGFLIYRGRIDDQINCGGLSFFPAEVERLIGRVDGVREYVIAGVDDPRGLYGQVPWAFVQPVDAAAYSGSAFMRVARQRVPAAKRPRRAVIVRDIPRTRSGKVDRLRAARLFGPDPA